MKCERAGCQLPAEYHVSGVLVRGKVEFKGFSGGFFTAPPQSSTGTETEELSLYACDEHSARADVSRRLSEANKEARRLHERGLSQDDGYAQFGAWRIEEYKRERLPN